jgi:hypothetical protein
LRTFDITCEAIIGPTGFTPIMMLFALLLLMRGIKLLLIRKKSNQFALPNMPSAFINGRVAQLALRTKS